MAASLRFRVLRYLPIKPWAILIAFSCETTCYLAPCRYAAYAKRATKTTHSGKNSFKCRRSSRGRSEYTSSTTISMPMSTTVFSKSARSRMAGVTSTGNVKNNRNSRYLSPNTLRYCVHDCQNCFKVKYAVAFIQYPFARNHLNTSRLLQW